MRYKNETQIFNSKNSISDKSGVIGLKYADDATLAIHGIYPISETKYKTDTHKLDKWVLADGRYKQKVIPLNKAEREARFPSRVEKLQLRLALIDSGIHISTIDGMIDSMQDGAEKEKALELWNSSTHYDRTNPLLLSFARELGLTTDEIKELFKKADTL